MTDEKNIAGTIWQANGSTANSTVDLVNEPSTENRPEKDISKDYGINGS